jgi:hypothetical protein
MEITTSILMDSYDLNSHTMANAAVVRIQLQKLKFHSHILHGHTNVPLQNVDCFYVVNLNST